MMSVATVTELAQSYRLETFASHWLCDLLLIAIFVAASERRYKAMLAAAGLACGLSPYGAMQLPLAIGLTFSRKIDPRALLLVPLTAYTAYSALFATGIPHLGSATSSVGLWAILSDPALAGLLVAIALGSAAWFTATLSARPVTNDTLTVAAAACALGYALVMPEASLAVPLALSLRLADRRVPILTAIATSMAVAACPVAATITLAIAFALAARPFLVMAANDNPVLART